MMTINEAKAIAERLKAIHRRQFLAEQRDGYNLYRAEARACGYEVESFEEYIGGLDMRAEFEEYYASLSDADLAQH